MAVEYVKNDVKKISKLFNINLAYQQRVKSLSPPTQKAGTIHHKDHKAQSWEGSCWPRKASGASKVHYISTGGKEEQQQRQRKWPDEATANKIRAPDYEENEGILNPL